MQDTSPKNVYLKDFSKKPEECEGKVLTVREKNTLQIRQKGMSCMLWKKDGGVRMKVDHRSGIRARSKTKKHMQGNRKGVARTKQQPIKKTLHIDF